MWRVGELALLQAWVCVSACAACKCANCVMAEFQVRWGKNKKHSVGQRGGLEAVLLQYGLYVFGHLSKWFVFVLMFKFCSVCRLVSGRPTIGYNLFILAILHACFQHIAN